EPVTHGRLGTAATWSRKSPAVDFCLPRAPRPKVIDPTQAALPENRADPRPPVSKNSWPVYEAVARPGRGRRMMLLTRTWATWCRATGVKIVEPAGVA